VATLPFHTVEPLTPLTLMTTVPWFMASENVATTLVPMPTLVPDGDPVTVGAVTSSEPLATMEKGTSVMFVLPA